MNEPPAQPSRSRRTYLLPAIVAIPAAIALFGFAAQDSRAVGQIGCGTEVNYHTRHARITDQYIKGYVEVGFEDGMTVQDAAATLDGLNAWFAFDYPYHRYAWVCTRPGEEEKWRNILLATNGVQYAHQEGVHPLSIDN